MTFLIAALSKAMASSITYPFSLAKSRAQVSSKSPAANDTETFSEKDSAKDIEKKAARKFRNDTIFDTLIKIAKEEGLPGLYQGLSGEVLKGFFSHGFTMLLKERIHQLIIQLYYLVLKATKKYPSRDELAKLASEKASDVKDAIGETASDVGEKAMQVKDVVTEKVSVVKDAAKNAMDVGQNALKEATDQSQNVLDRSIEAVSELYRRGKEETADIMDDYVEQDDDDDNGWGW